MLRSKGNMNISKHAAYIAPSRPGHYSVSSSMLTIIDTRYIRGEGDNYRQHMWTHHHRGRVELPFDGLAREGNVRPVEQCEPRLPRAPSHGRCEPRTARLRAAAQGEGRNPRADESLDAAPDEPAVGREEEEVRLSKARRARVSSRPGP